MAGCLGRVTPRKSSRISVRDDPRQDALGRLIVRSLEDIIGDDVAGPNGDGRIPRSAAIGVAVTVKQALGPRTVKEYQGLCRRALVRLSRGRRVPNWDAFYEDAIAREILESMLVATAFHFERSGPGLAAFAAWVDAASGRLRGTTDGR